MSWMTREGKYTKKLVEVASMHDVREGASTGVADNSSVHSTDIAVVDSTDVESGVGFTETMSRVGSTDIGSGAGVGG
jgi:hypothetical protein